MKRIDLPIGVFDSGVGGLTVLDALRRRLPGEDLLYLGDTARVPYGTRAPETVVRYAHRVAGHLVRRGVKALVIACNTATTWALSELERAAAPLHLPVIGVIAPGVEAALRQTRTGHVAVIGTEGTVRGGAYARHLVAARAGVQVRSLACPLFVSLAEEGWTEGEIARLTAERYLAPLRVGAHTPDTLILGCTHYPLLRGVISQALPGVQLIDSASAAAAATAARLGAEGLLRPRGAGGADHFLVTDHVDRFRRVGARFLQAAPDPVELVDLTDADDAALPAPPPVRA